MLTCDQNNAFSCTDVSPLSARALESFSMCVVNEKFVYVTGGSYADDETLANCHRYDIVRNQWQEMKQMRQARMRHSSCQLAGHIYVFCGMIELGNMVNSVEKLSIEADPNLQVSKGWEQIAEANLTALPGLSMHMSVALNDFEIVMLGGYG